MIIFSPIYADLIKNFRTNEPHKFDDVKLFPIEKMIRDPDHVHSQLPLFLEKYKNRLM